ncbi:hypothetical protein [Candidatus Bathycorpusculum sp.]|uniref:hypothetical protein n=1 Tax=Candidatus Bathycorpusculum sp. TaxID=2994959 RepID=UPI00281E141B|nr:hypothetical protein [Candidatus Termitimicrobium sp.]
MVIKEAARKIKDEAKRVVTRENAGKVYQGAKRAAGQAADAGMRYGARVQRNTATSPLISGRTIHTSTGNWTVDNRREPIQRTRNRSNRSQNSGNRPQNNGDRSRGEHISYDRRGGEYISYGTNSRREHVSFAGNHQRRESISFGGGQSRGSHISFAGPSQGNQKRGGNRRRRRRR